MTKKTRLLDEYQWGGKKRVQCGIKNKWISIN